MKNEMQHIECPNCGHSINVNDIVFHQMKEKAEKEYSNKLAALDKQEQGIKEAIEQGVKKQLGAKKTELEKAIRNQVSEEKSEEIESYKNQLTQKTQELKNLNKLKSELEQVKREKEGLRETIELESQQKITQLIAAEKTRIRGQVDRENEMKLSEKDNMIEKLREQTKDMQRKLEQGSMQVQGETQELAIEEHLRSCFPLDRVEEIGKGVRGGDTLQIVNTRTHQNCGSIYYESKRTKDFQPKWIEKFKEDLRLKNATIGAIVTDSMPKDMPSFGQKDGIWICTFQEFKGLCFVLREMVIMYSTALGTQTNKGEKMEMLYNYLTSNEFRLQIEAIVSGFSQMEQDLTSERRSMEGIWKKREKQIQKVLQNTVHMYSSIKGIAGSAIGSIKALELPSPDEGAE